MITLRPRHQGLLHARIKLVLRARQGDARERRGTRPCIVHDHDTRGRLGPDRHVGMHAVRPRRADLERARTRIVDALTELTQHRPQLPRTSTKLQEALRIALGLRQPWYRSSDVLLLILEFRALGAHMRERGVHRRQRHSIRLGKRHVPLERDAPRLLRFVRTPRNTRVRQRPILRHTLGVRTHESGARHAPPPVPEEEGHDDDDGSVEGGPWASRLGYKQTRPLRRAVVVIRYVCVRRFAVVAWSLGGGVVLWRR